MDWHDPQASVQPPCLILSYSWIQEKVGGCHQSSFHGCICKRQEAADGRRVVTGVWIWPGPPGESPSESGDTQRPLTLTLITGHHTQADFTINTLMKFSTVLVDWSLDRKSITQCKISFKCLVCSDVPNVKICWFFSSHNLIIIL